jgi:hypothetical protein
MRSSNANAARGVTRRDSNPLKRLPLVVLVLVVGVWVAYVFAQEAYVGHSLSDKAAQLRHQNELIAAQNQGYQKDISALTSGAGDEETARMNGYARPDEHVYLVTTSPTPTPTP